MSPPGGCYLLPSPRFCTSRYAARRPMCASLDGELDTPLPIGTVRPHTGRLSQVVTVIAVVVPPLALLSAMGVLWGIAFHPVDLVLFLVLYVLCAFGTT